MSYTVIVHLLNSDPLIAEMEELPDPHTAFVTFTSPRLRDGKQVDYLDPEATSFIFPWSRINFVEVMGSQAERGQVLEFFRD